MASHIKQGEEGEELAANWLLGKGYKILHRNWRFSHYEIDIIAKKNTMLHFIEVKCRKSSPFGNPEDAVNRTKFKHMQWASDAYLRMHPGYRWIQYDVLAITLFNNREPEYFLLEDVFL